MSDDNVTVSDCVDVVLQTLKNPFDWARLEVLHIAFEDGEMVHYELRFTKTNEDNGKDTH